jgi:heme/copper-type cytochrome/quinol oxidase subunit 1
MRWSERPPAASSRFASLQPLRCGPPTLSMAVAHLILVRVHRTPPVTTRTKQRILNSLAAVPVLWLALLYLLVVRARLQFGHWPSDSDGMAKYTGFSGHRDLIIYSLYVSSLAVIGAFIWAIALRRKDSAFPIWKSLAVVALSAAVVTLLVAIDPGGFIIWVVD